jgi:DNA-binding NarL/FixJ family response regulator
VLKLVGEGLSNPQIAKRLVLSPHTVHRHVANIMAKLDVTSRTAAVGMAARRGVL